MFYITTTVPVYLSSATHILVNPSFTFRIAFHLEIVEIVVVWPSWGVCWYLYTFSIPCVWL